MKSEEILERINEWTGNDTINDRVLSDLTFAFSTDVELFEAFTALVLAERHDRVAEMQKVYGEDNES